MNHLLRRRSPGIALGLLAIALCSACTLPGPKPDDGSQREGYGFAIYEPFDNSRDWGPGYLVGPPLRPKLYPNDYSNRSAGSVLHPATAPSIPTGSPNSDPPVAPPN
ncbi:MAG: hypothetical protein ABSF94_13750 [Steroidobacteraceae bacterium]|jgi:hypothetical protein